MSGAGVCSEVVGPWLGLAGTPFASVRLRPWGGGRGRWRPPLRVGDVCSADPRRAGTQIARSPQFRPACPQVSPVKNPDRSNFAFCTRML